MNTSAGEIRIDLSHRAGAVQNIRITSSRPTLATRVLIGNTPEKLLLTVPMLFSVCGNAQAFAALLCCRSALGQPNDPATDAVLGILVQMETLREHAWRILSDWPLLIEEASDRTALASIFKFDSRVKRLFFQNGEIFKIDSGSKHEYLGFDELTSELKVLIDTAIFGNSLDQFLAISNEAQLKDWLAESPAPAAKPLKALYDRDWLALGRCNCLSLPELDLAALHQTLLREDLTEFSRAPVWQDQSRETTPFSRQQKHPLLEDVVSKYGNGLLPRYLAMLTEMAQLINELPRQPVCRADAIGVADGIGLAAVAAARGLLIHRLVLRNGRVHDYRIVAPTEWNFHPDGVLKQSLSTLSAGDGDCLRKQTEWLVQAIDPCVQYQINLNEA